MSAGALLRTSMPTFDGRRTERKKKKQKKGKESENIGLGFPLLLDDFFFVVGETVEMRSTGENRA